MTDILIEEGIKSVALTYTNNDYGKGFGRRVRFRIRSGRR